MLQKIIAFVLFLISISLVFYWNVIRDADKKAMNQLEVALKPALQALKVT